MCGIAGYFKKNTNSDSPELVKKMLKSIRHRGPDDEGIYSDDTVCLGHCRLSILDLTQAGHQPMASDDQRYQIVYNGEIYNYIELKEELRRFGCKFRTQTDTEVLLQAYRVWGKECLRRLNGMWSFVIWDCEREELFFARDRFGVKPFVYYTDDERFVFASEIKALLHHPIICPEPNRQTIYDFIVYGRANHEEETFFKGIFQLPGAHYGILNRYGLHVQRYWDIEQNRFEGSLTEAAEEFRRIFEDAVRIRFRSDVEVGSCLSGGLDSSSIVCMADRMISDGRIDTNNGFQTFSLFSRFPRFDESKWVDIVKKHTRINSHHICLSEEELLAELQRLVYVQDEPFGSTSIFGQYMVMQSINRHGIKVTLDGQGSDEMLAGYLSYADSYFADLYVSGDEESLYRQVDIFCRKHGLTPSIAIERARRLAETGAFGRHIEANVKFLAPELRKDCHKEIILCRKFDSFLQNHLYQDLTSLSLPSFLRYEDRNSMAYSIESRLPFLDYRLVEFAFSLPVSMKLHNSVTKVVLRQAMHGILPEQIANRQDKMGFVTPESVWFREGFMPVLDQLFHGKELADRGLFDIGNVIKEWEDFKQGRKNDSFLIWRIASVELWYRTFIDRSPGGHFDG